MNELKKKLEAAGWPEWAIQVVEKAWKSGTRPINPVRVPKWTEYIGLDRMMENV